MRFQKLVQFKIYYNFMRTLQMSDSKFVIENRKYKNISRSNGISLNFFFLS